MRFSLTAAPATRPRTLKDYQRLLKHFPFGRTALADIKPRDILTQLQPLTPYEKHHAFQVATIFFRWCLRQHMIDRSPTDTMAIPYNGKPRERVLSPDELCGLLQCVRTHETPFHRIVELLILTGARRGEIAALQWEWINETERTITFPSSVTKNKRTHSIPYGDLVHNHFGQMDKMVGCPYVFPAARKRSETTTVFAGWGKPKAALDKQLNIAPWVLHDIRRSYATYMQQLGVRIEVTERLLNHVSGSQSGIVGVYQRYSWMPEMREAVGKWERYLTELVTTITAPS